MPKNSKTQIKEDEKHVLQLLQQDARESIDKIAKQLGFSRQKVWRIIKRMEQNQTIWGYPAEIDTNKFNQQQYHLLIKRTNKAISKPLINTIISHDIETLANNYNIQIRDSLFIHGPYDWLLTITAPSIKEVKTFMEAFQKKFEGHIEQTDITQVLFPLKKNGLTNPEIETFKDYFP